MIVAATSEGIVDLETGVVVVSQPDTRFVAQRVGVTWVILGDTKLIRNDGSGWRPEVDLDGERARVAIPLDDGVLIGTDGARVLRVQAGSVKRLDAFDAVPGRDKWYNPASPQPDLWSFARSGQSVFASVHVGGLWRSDDDGDTWVNALQPEVDIHQVAANDEVVVAAAEHGFAFSYDRGDTWTWTNNGLHAHYLQCVALAGDAVYVGASSGPFGDDAAIYRAERPGAIFERASRGLPDSLEAIAPYRLAVDGATLAITGWSAGSGVYLSHDEGASWSPVASTLPWIHSLAAFST